MVEKEAKKEHDMMFAPSHCLVENQACVILVYDMFSLLINTFYMSFFCNLWHFTVS